MSRNPLKMQTTRIFRAFRSRSKETPVLESLFASPKAILLLLPIFLTAATVVHYFGFQSPMIYDSQSWISDKAHIFARNDLTQVFSLVPGRPLFVLSLYFNFVVGGMDPVLYRLVNSVILGLTGLIFTVLATLVLEMPGVRVGGTTSQKRLVAVFLGLFFVVHPLQSFVVLYVWQRAAIMACLFYFSSLAVYLALRSGRLQQPVPAYILVQILFLGAILSKENAATLPFALLLSEVTLFRLDIRQLAKRVVTIALITLPPFILYVLALRFSYGAESGTPPEVMTRLLTYYQMSGMSPLQVFMTECRVLFSYLPMILLPGLFEVQFIRAEVISTSFWTPPSTPFAVMGFVGLLGIGLSTVKRIPLLAFGILFYFISSAPEAYLMPKYLFVGYRPILPMAGVLITLGFAVLALLEWAGPRLSPRSLKISGACVLAFPIACAAAMTVDQAFAWNPVQIWSDAFRNLPSYSIAMDKPASTDVLVNYSSVLINRGENARAIEILKKAVDRPGLTEHRKDADARPGSKRMTLGGDKRLHPAWRHNNFHDSKILFNLGLALKKSGNLKDAVKYYRMAVKADPFFARGYNNLGLALEESGELAPALAALRQASRLKPKSPLVNYNLANVLLKTGHANEAEKRYLMTLALNPGFVKAYANLGIAQLQSGQFTNAVTSFRKALPLDKDNAELHNALGVAYAELGKTSQAIRLFKKTLEIAPDHQGAKQNLRNVLSHHQRDSDPSAPTATEHK